MGAVEHCMNQQSAGLGFRVALVSYLGQQRIFVASRSRTSSDDPTSMLGRRWEATTTLDRRPDDCG